MEIAFVRAGENSGVKHMLPMEGGHLTSNAAVFWRPGCCTSSAEDQLAPTEPRRIGFVDVSCLHSAARFSAAVFPFL